MADQRIQSTEEMVGAGHRQNADTLNRLATAFALENDGTFSDHYIRIIDEKAANTAGGTFTNGAWRTRDLNKEDSDRGGHASLSSNKITLAAGTYICKITAPAHAVSQHKLKLYNTTGATNVLVGTSETTDNADGVTTRSVVSGRFTIAAAQALEVQHRCATTAATTGFGNATNVSEVEVYTVAEFWKVA